MTPGEAAWSAGLYEGEGCLTIKVRSQQPELRVGMTDEDVVRRFADVVGFPQERVMVLARPGRKTLYTVQINRRDEIARLYEAWRPWLGARRAARFEEALALPRRIRAA